MIITPTEHEVRHESPDAAELLIKEARQKTRRRRFRLGSIVLAALVIIAAVLIATGRATAPATKATSVANFLNSMKQANGTRFVVTYRLNGYLILQNGTIVIAQIPSPPGMKATTNVDGYSGTGRFAYIFHGPTGRIVQWIKNDTNVSACVNFPITGNYATGTFGKLQCSRPSPYIPSNGFAEQDVGFVPTYVLQSMTESFGARSLKKATVTTRASREFGPLRCLAQLSGPMTQTTCINQAGFVVSWLLQNGSVISSRATLTSLNHHPTADDFKTLLRPTKSFILPAV